MDRIKKNYIVIGLGQTGLSCIKFLQSLGHVVCVVDTRIEPPNKTQFKEMYPDVPLFCNQLPELARFKPFTLVLSPGISPEHALIKPLISAADEVSSDITLFMQCHSLPVIAITGANGKSTVTTLVGEMAKNCGLLPAVVGNIGIPVLSLIDTSTGQLKQPYDLIVMELSSFQLDITDTLKTKAAVVLNISPDHLDRYKDIHSYAQSKHKIYDNTEYAIINRDDRLSVPAQMPKTCKEIYFSNNVPEDGQFGLVNDKTDTYLYHGSQPLMNVAELKLMGQHNYLNALAALALGQAAGFSLEGMLTTLKYFSGLAHRCEWVTEHAGIQWINDSKGTNIAASASALVGLGDRLARSNGKIVIILGGQGKGQDFNEMIEPILKYCRAVVTMGECGPALFQLLSPYLHALQAKDMKEAVQLANNQARSGDIVLLSPACASWDQYQHFEHRGECFKEAIFSTFCATNAG